MGILERIIKIVCTAFGILALLVFIGWIIKGIADRVRGDGTSTPDKSATPPTPSSS